MRLDQAFDHVEAYARPAFAAVARNRVARQALRTFETHIVIFRRHPGSFVRHRQYASVAYAPLDIDGDGSSLRAAPHCVVEEVGKNAMELEEVALNRGISVIDQFEGDFGMADGPRFDRLACHACQVDGLSIELGTTLRSTDAEVEQLVEEFDSNAGLPSGIMPPLRRQRGSVATDSSSARTAAKPAIPVSGALDVMAYSDQELEAVGKHPLDLQSGSGLNLDHTFDHTDVGEVANRGRRSRGRSRSRTQARSESQRI